MRFLERLTEWPADAWRCRLIGSNGDATVLPLASSHLPLAPLSKQLLKRMITPLSSDAAAAAHGYRVYLREEKNLFPRYFCYDSESSGRFRRFRGAE